MGYRSEVAYAIVCENEEDLGRLLARLPEGDLELMREDGLTVEGGGVYFHAPWVKWYASRLVGDGGGFKDVDRHERLMRLSREAADDGVELVGVFVRVGEERDDTEEESWGESLSGNLPDPWELAQVRVGIDMSNNWPL